MQRGDLVRWFELYDDDFVKDAGSGVVLETKWWRHDEAAPYTRSTIIHVIHRVYKFKTSSEEWFAENNLEILAEKK